MMRHGERGRGGGQDIVVTLSCLFLRRRTLPGREGLAFTGVAAE